MQFLLKRKRNSVKEVPGADLLYETKQFPLTGCAPHSPAAGDGKCGISALMTVGDESFKVSFQYADYSSEPFLNFKTGEPFYIDVQDGDETLTIQCYRIEHLLMNSTGNLVAEFAESSFADGKPSFYIYEGDKQLGGKWTLLAPSKEDFIYAIQRHVSRMAMAKAS